VRLEILLWLYRPKKFRGSPDMGPRDDERKIWAQGDTLSTKRQPTCRRDSDHHVRQSSQGIVRIVATRGEYLRLYLTPNRLSSHPQKKPRKRRKLFSITSYSKSLQRYNYMICCV